MNETRYCRNRIYITEAEQTSIANCKIVLGGAGIGSIIAECALRAGFENIHIIDGDRVELSNLNRQNYITDDIGRYKAEVVFERLMKINPNANISFSTEFITSGNIEEQLKDARIAINALDFTSEIPFDFDDFCISRHIPILHPYNLGWAGFVTVVCNEESNLRQLQAHSCDRFELMMGKYITDHLAKTNRRQTWLEDVIKEVENEKERLSPPQLSIASWITAGLSTDILFKIATGKTVQLFPEFYYSSSTQY